MHLYSVATSSTKLTEQDLAFLHSNSEVGLIVCYQSFLYVSTEPDLQMCSSYNLSYICNIQKYLLGISLTQLKSVNILNVCWSQNPYSLHYYSRSHTWYKADI